MSNRPDIVSLVCAAIVVPWQIGFSVVVFLFVFDGAWRGMVNIASGWVAVPAAVLAVLPALVGIGLAAQSVVRRQGSRLLAAVAAGLNAVNALGEIALVMALVR